jgi:hypothetical protein
MTGMEWFRQAEADLALFEPSIGGFSLWPALRFSAWQLLSGVRTTGAPAKGIAQRRAEKLLGLATYGLWSLAQKRRLRGKPFDLAVITQEAHRLETPRGWWDLYLDDVAAHAAFDGRVLRIERRDFALARARTVASRHLFSDLQRLNTKRSGAAEATTVADATCDLFFKRLETRAVDEQAFRSRARQIAHRFQDDLSWYESLWREFRPATVALVDAYNQHGAVAAAKRCDIPVVEFQHGNIHPDHPGYIWFGPARAIRDRLAIPDRIATYGSYWSDVLLQEGSWMRGEVPAIGSARIDRIRNERSPRQGARLRILFTSQFATREQTIPLLSEFIHRAESATLDYELAIKVHRNERDQMGEYEALRAISAAVSVVSPYAKDTLEMIASADVHVSAWSTCHYEAVALGTPTIVLVFPGPDRVEGLKEFSLVTRASTASELLECLQRVRPGEIHAAQHDESNRLFRFGAVENAVELVRALSRANP